MAHLFQAFACHKPKDNLNDDDINRIHLNEPMESSSKASESNIELENRLKFLYSLACGNEPTPDVQQLKTVGSILILNYLCIYFSPFMDAL